MKKTLLSILSCIFLAAICMVAVSCGVSESQGSEVPDTDALKYALKGDEYSVVGIGDYDEGILDIPSQHKGKPVTSIGEGAFKGVLVIGIVIIPDTVKTIEKEAFSQCSNITAVTMNDSVTEIGESAFSYCSNMESVTGLGSVVNIGERAFEWCTRLKTIVFPDSLKIISANAFYRCRALTQVTFGTGLEVIGASAFETCQVLTAVDIPDGAPTEIMSRAFYDCTKIGRVNLGDSVTYIGDSVFETCTYIREVVIGDSVISVGENAFNKCSKIHSVTLGSSLITIGDNAFASSVRLKEIYNRSKINITLGSTANGYVGAYAWYVRQNDEPTRISEENGAVYYTEGNRKALITINLTEHSDVTVPDDVTEIADHAFYNEQFVTGVKIGSGCTTIGESAFRNSYKIQYVILGENVTTIGDCAFRYSSYIDTIVVGKKLTTVGREAFMKKEGDKNNWRDYKKIIYEGTQEQWNTISFASGNTHLVKSGNAVASGITLYTDAIYSEEQPSSAGNYWHRVYGIPVMWTQQQ